VRNVILNSRKSLRSLRCRLTCW